MPWSKPQRDDVCTPEEEAVRVALRQRREHFQRVLARHERERRLFAEQLIDAAADALVMTHPALPGQIVEPEDQRVVEMRGVLADLLNRLGVLADQLHPAVLDDAGLAAALDQLGEEAGSRTLRPVVFDIDPALAKLPNDVALAFYRVAEDLLAATTGPLRMQLRCAMTGWVELVAVAGEAGISGHVVKPGRLLLARARIDLLGGLLSTSTPRGGGLLLHAELPVAT